MGRRQIELRMELFKKTEKDSKQKEYWKSALKAALHEQMEEQSPDLTSDQLECAEWIEEMKDKLIEQNNEIEEELEKLNASRKKKSKNNEVIQSKNSRLDRNKWHLSKLQMCVEKMIKGNSDPNLYKDIQDDVEYYVDEAMEDEHYQQFDEMYEIIEEDVSEEDEPKTEENETIIPTKSETDQNNKDNDKINAKSTEKPKEVIVAKP